MPTITGPTNQQIQTLRDREDQLSDRAESLEEGRPPKVDVHKIFDHVEALARQHNRADLVTGLSDAISFRGPGGSEGQRTDASLLQLARVLETGADLPTSTPSSLSLHGRFNAFGR